MASANLRKRGPGRPPNVLKRGPGRPPSAETLRKRRLLERATKRLEASAKRGPGRPRKDATERRKLPNPKQTFRPRKAVTPVARAARKRNAALGGRPGRVCLHCLRPVLGGHRDKAFDAACGFHGFAWRPPSGLTTAEIRKAITDEIAALYGTLYRLDTVRASGHVGAVPVDVAAVSLGADRATGQETHAPGLRRARKAAPAREDAPGEAIGPPAIGEAAPAAPAATGPAYWRGLDANGECLDCDEPADAHAADCPYWTSRQDVATERTTEAEAPAAEAPIPF